MKKKPLFKRLQPETYRILASIAFGTITAAVLISALFVSGQCFSGEGNLTLGAFLTFFFLMLSRIFLGLFSTFGQEKNRFNMIKNFVFATVFLAGAILTLCLPPASLLFTLLAVCYIAPIVANRICLIIQGKKIGMKIINGFLAAIGLFMLIVFCFASEEEGALNAAIALFIFIVLVSLSEVMAFAFAKMQLRGLLAIIRKTYVLEILYGLLILIVSFSFYFQFSEPAESKIQTFWDGLWYSFAVVTTIGFGDMTVVNPISRVLTVILGCYGIVVTASITSVIVNYYNEVRLPSTKREDTEEEPEEGAQENDVTDEEQPSDPE